VSRKGSIFPIIFLQEHLHLYRSFSRLFSVVLLSKLLCSVYGWGGRGTMEIEVGVVEAIVFLGERESSSFVGGLR